MSRGPKNSSPPALALATVVLLSEDHCHVDPETVPRTIAIGMTVKIRKKVVSRSSERSG
jgi:hypothetical protein